MPSKTPALRIDSQPARPTSGASPASSATEYTPPSRSTIEPPENIILSTGPDRSAATPTAYIYIAWTIPRGPVPTGYIAQLSTDNTFPVDNTQSVVVRTNYTTVHFLKTGTIYYVRVAAQSGSRQSAWADSANITTAIDTVQPAAPTNLALTWNTDGSLIVTWTPSTSANARDTEIAIYSDSGKTTHYRTVYRTSPLFEYTVAMNGQDTSGLYDASLYVEIRTRGWNGLFSATSLSASATKSAPTAPVVSSQSWAGDTGAAGPDWTLTIAAAVGVAYRTVTIDGKVIRFSGTTLTYTLDANRADHSGTPDPVLTYSVVAYDALGQASPTTSGTATNAAPAAPTATLEQGAVGGLFATVTSTPPADFWRYEFVFKRDSTTVATVYSTGATYRYEMSGASDGGYHSWTVVVRQQDLFAQFSATHTPSAVTVEALTLSFLRDDIVYSDSIGTAAATLKAALADGGTTSGGITYAA